MQFHQCKGVREQSPLWCGPHPGDSQVLVVAWPEDASGGLWDNKLSELSEGDAFVDCKGSREVLNSVLEETNSHLTQSFTIPWCNTPTYALSLSFSLLLSLFFSYLYPTHSVCLSRTLVLCGNKLNEWTWLFEWVYCSAHSPFIYLHICLIAFQILPRPPPPIHPPGVKLTFTPWAAAKHDSTSHPFTRPSPSPCHSLHSHKAQSPCIAFHNSALHLFTLPLCVSPTATSNCTRERETYFA